MSTFCQRLVCRLVCVMPLVFSMQGFEGISLACTFLDAGYSNIKYFLFSAVFVLVTPVGVGACCCNRYQMPSLQSCTPFGRLNHVCNCARSGGACMCIHCVAL